MKKRIVKKLSLLFVFLLVLVSACSSKTKEDPLTESENGSMEKDDSEAAEVVEATFAHIFEPGHTLSEMSDMFAARVEEETQGRVKITVVPAGALGGMDSNIEALSLGSVDITLGGESYTSTYYEPMGVSTAPYAFRDWEHFRKYLESDLFADFKEEYGNSTGNVIVGSYTSGFRSVTSNKPIQKPEDMAGLKIRVPDAPAFTAMPEAAGASPAPMALSEVYLALQQKVVDAQENPLETTYSQKFYEVQKYICMTEHMMEPSHIIASGTFWSKLSEEDQSAVLKAAKEVSAWATDQAEASSMELLDTFEELGCTIVRDVDKEGFAELCTEFNTSEERGWTKEQWDALQAL